MKIFKKAILEEPGAVWDIHRNSRIDKIELDADGSFSTAGQKFFVSTIRRSKPYKRSPFLPWLKAQDEIYFCASGVPTSVPPLHEIWNMQKVEARLQFSAQQMELLAREKETGMYLKRTIDWVLLIAGLGFGLGVGAIAMYALQKWQG